MKVLIDIGHPGHVHYYKNLIKRAEYADIEFLVIARNKEPIPKLLKSFDIKYKLRHEGKYSKLGKLLYLFYGNLFLLKNAIKFKPDVLLSHGGIYTALAGFLLRKNIITTEDTELATLSHSISKRFSSYILTPEVFSVNLGKKQVKFNSYMEYAYLHHDYFQKKASVIEKYGLRQNDKYILVRLVDWTAHHDFGIEKVSSEDKIDIVTELSKSYRVILSYETSIPELLKKYALNIAPEDLHHLLAFASLYIGEGATTASESSILGTPAIYINPMQVCYCRDQEENHGLSFNLTKKEAILKKAKELLIVEKREFIKRSEKMAADKMDTTKFLYNFIKQLN